MKIQEFGFWHQSFYNFSILHVTEAIEDFPAVQEKGALRSKSNVEESG